MLKQHSITAIQPGEDRADKVRRMLDDFFNRTKPGFSFREAYIDITGDKHVSGRLSDCDPTRMREAAGINFREAIDSSTFADILGDSITRATIREYNQAEQFMDWRWLVDQVLVNDFRTQKRTRLGGYGNLPGVNENAPYNSLTTPTDEQATYTVSKRGGTESLTLETIANDDVGLIRRIPVALGQAANRTIYQFVYNFISSNATIYDTLALFHASHGNLGSAALSGAAFSAARLAMKKQTEKDSAAPLGLQMKHLIVPPDLEETAYNLFQRGTNLDADYVQAANPTIHVPPDWTDTNNWFATGDTAQVPLIEVGFYGNVDPQIFVQDAPNAGSLFSNDKVTYKIRHVYSGAVMDYRGFYGAIVA